MPRTEVYQLRLSKSEKDELAQRAKLQGVSIAKLIRQKLNLDAQRDNGLVEDLKREIAMDEISGTTQRYDEAVKTLTAQHKRFMSTRKAEAKARKELERNPS